MCDALYIVPKIAKFKRSFAAQARTIRGKGRIVKPAAAPTRNWRRVVVVFIAGFVRSRTAMLDASDRPPITVLIFEKLSRVGMIRDFAGERMELDHLTGETR
jgi:hypothetical protein